MVLDPNTRGGNGEGGPSQAHISVKVVYNGGIGASNVPKTALNNYAKCTVNKVDNSYFEWSDVYSKFRGLAAPKKPAS